MQPLRSAAQSSPWHPLQKCSFPGEDLTTSHNKGSVLCDRATRRLSRSATGTPPSPQQRAGVEPLPARGVKIPKQENQVVCSPRLQSALQTRKEREGTRGCLHTPRLTREGGRHASFPSSRMEEAGQTGFAEKPIFFLGPAEPTVSSFSPLPPPPTPGSDLPRGSGLVPVSLSNSRPEVSPKSIINILMKPKKQKAQVEGGT